MPKLARVIVSVVGTFLILIPGIAGAVDYGGVGGQPANPSPDNPRTKSIFIYTLNPGDKKTDAITIFNNTDQQKTVALDAVDSVTSSDGAFACAQSADEKKEVGDWITLSKTQVVLSANGKEDVPFEIVMPSTAGVGEHDGCITIQDVSATAASQETNGVVLGFRSALRVIITVPGDIVKQLSFVSLDIKDKPNSNGYIVQPAVKNEGNVSVDAKINTTMKTIFGTTVQSEGGTYPVLPGSTGRWNFEYDKPFWGGWYAVQATATYNNDTSKSVGEEGNLTTIMTSKKFMFVLPSPLALLIELLIVAVIAVAGWFIYRKLNKPKKLSRGALVYRVKEGDSLHALAKKAGINWKDVATLNKIKPPYHLEPGSTIRIPKYKSGTATKKTLKPKG